MNSVETTLPLLFTAVTPCFASSLTVTNVPAVTSPPDAIINPLFLLIFEVGFVGLGGFVAKAVRCCGRACL
jgi:hypothetical protein